jgi:hypothetical protein
LQVSFTPVARVTGKLDGTRSTYPWQAPSRKLRTRCRWRRTPALRFGDPRVQALAGALCTTLLAATGITSKSLRALMTGLLHAPYTPGQMTYDLRRLRLAGLIRRIEHTNRYVLTPDGTRTAIFYTKVHNRLLRPLLAADQPQAPPELRTALRTIEVAHRGLHHPRPPRQSRVKI